MKWEVKHAKNNEKTLKLNNISIYSTYRPLESVEKWIKAEVDMKVDNYLLIGLGLGYHLKSLINCTKNKKIVVYYFDQEELSLFYENNNDGWWKVDNIQIVNTLKGKDFKSFQVLIPNSWLTAIGETHPLFNSLEIIKITQNSYKNNADKMQENFHLNCLLGDVSFMKTRQEKVACLVAAGPSLDKTIDWLKIYQEKIDIFAVGTVLKKLLMNEIIPTAIVLTDANDVIKSQIDNSGFTRNLYYLSTTNHSSVKLHQGPRYIMYQEGYTKAEEVAKKYNYPMIETGGSVATATLSLIEALGYKHVILFGLDLGFESDKTHAVLTNSVFEGSKEKFRKIVANDDSVINTHAMFQVFLQWFNEKMKDSELNVYNTAEKGAKINQVPLIDKKTFEEIVCKNY
ncbi:6-hydroxymethylpterin diphosphokinase MptE-like protein [Lysinibacillus sp. fls2-241-R2A-57]|uniref:6-hydroxymethylpterin diphosphokinase MptE-like protein n=1 Tax=Lysinibacillus sp. fls2-241-R2A-57 TaxID=3040292 RepID=UPI002553D4A9|nr:6-hydroxymethylpterin diphosphokinase MptE-like protein [Lysinibacillus sp. fls2-241-R2A-57]